MNKLLVFVMLLMAGSLMGQGGVNSPFSRYGIGDLQSEAPMHLRQMGGLGTAFIDYQHLNFDNPASLGYLKSTAFDLGLDFKRSTISDAQNESKQWSGNLGYLQMGFPLRNPVNAVFENEEQKFNWGMGFALLPNSTVSYNIAQLDSTANNDVYVRQFSGEGGSYKAIVGNSFRYGNFSVGASIGWLFGKIDYVRNVDFEEITAFDNQFSSSYSFRGFYSKLGVNYLHTFNQVAVDENNGRVHPNNLSVGLSYKPGVGFNTKSEVSNLNFLFFQTESTTDTLTYAGDIPGKGRLPSELSFGAVYTHGYKWGLGFDLKLTNWSKYYNEAGLEGEREEGAFSNTRRIGVGGFYRPDFASINSIFERATYKLGFYVAQDPRSIENEKINTWAITTGVGLPMAWQRKFSQLDLGLDFGKRSVSGIINENFMQITFGFTFNESDWFRKSYLD